MTNPKTQVPVLARTTTDATGAVRFDFIIALLSARRPSFPFFSAWGDYYFLFIWCIPRVHVHLLVFEIETARHHCCTQSYRASPPTFLELPSNPSILTPDKLTSELLSSHK